MIYTYKLQFSKIIICENIKKFKERKWKHMKKLVKKIVVAVMAMAMAIGMLAVTASADNLDVTACEEWYVKGSFNGWADVRLTKDGSVYYADVELAEAKEYEFVVYVKNGSDIYLKDQNGGGNFKFTSTEANKTLRITVDPAKLGSGDNFWGDTFYPNLYKNADEAGSDSRSGIYADIYVAPPAPTGDATPYIAIAAVAVLALGAVVILASKKKVVTE